MSSRRRNSSKLDRFLAKHGLKKVRLLLQGKEVDAGEPCAEVELVAPPPEVPETPAQAAAVPRPASPDPELQRRIHLLESNERTLQRVNKRLQQRAEAAATQAKIAIEREVVFVATMVLVL